GIKQGFGQRGEGGGVVGGECRGGVKGLSAHVGVFVLQRLQDGLAHPRVFRLDLGQRAASRGPVRGRLSWVVKQCQEAWHGWAGLRANGAQRYGGPALVIRLKFIGADGQQFRNGAGRGGSEIRQT